MATGAGNGPIIPLVTTLPDAATNDGRILRTSAGLWASVGGGWVPATGESFGVYVSRAAGINAGGYYAERYAPIARTFTKFFALAEGGGQCNIRVKVNGAKVYGPVPVAGAVVSVTGLSIAVPAGANVVMEVSSVVTPVTAVWARVEA